MRWTGNGECKVDGYEILCSGRDDDNHRSGVGFCLTDKACRATESFTSISERLAKIIVQSKWFKLSIITAYSSTEENDDTEKDDIYEKIQEIVELTPRHDLILLLGDFYTKIGHEVDALGPAIGRNSAHGNSSKNGIRFTSFANSNRMVACDTIFLHKAIDKHTWNSSDGNTSDQIDHILI